MKKLEEIFTKQNIKTHFVDALAAWVFFQPIRMISETYAGGLEAPEFWKSRLIGLVTGLTIAPPLTKLADVWEEKIWKVTDDKQYARRIGAALSYAIPLGVGIYSAVLKSSGADWDEIIKTVPTNLGISIPIAAIIYRGYLDKVRNFFNTTPNYLKHKANL